MKDKVTCPAIPTTKGMVQCYWSSLDFEGNTVLHMQWWSRKFVRLSDLTVILVCVRTLQDTDTMINFPDFSAVFPALSEHEYIVYLVVYCGPFTWWPKKLPILPGTQNRRGLCNRSRLPRTMLCHLGHLVTCTKWLRSLGTAEKIVLRVSAAHKNASEPFIVPY